MEYSGGLTGRGLRSGEGKEGFIGVDLELSLEGLFEKEICLFDFIVYSAVKQNI